MDDLVLSTIYRAVDAIPNSKLGHVSKTGLRC
jgi:hypothetical protein